MLTTLGVFLNSLKMCCLHYRHLSGDVANWLDRAKENNGGCYSETSVENVKILFKLFPLFGLQLLYRACITQVSVYQNQLICIHAFVSEIHFCNISIAILLTDSIGLLSADYAFQLKTQRLSPASSSDEGHQYSAGVDLSTTAGARAHLLPVSKENTALTSHIYK